MADNASRDQNSVPTLLGVSSSDGTSTVKIYADPTTHRLLVNSTGGGGGTPGGNNGDIQYNNAGTFGGTDNAIIDSSGNIISNGNLQLQGSASMNSLNVAINASFNNFNDPSANFTIFDSNGSSAFNVQADNVTTLNNTLEDGSGNANISGNITVNGQIDSNRNRTTVNGSVSGSAQFSQAFGGASYNKVIIHLAALNGTATYTYITPFTFTPVVMSTNGLATTLVTSVSTTAVTVTGATSTGFLFLEGF